MSSSNYQNEFEGKTPLLVKSFKNKNGYRVKVMLYEEEPSYLNPAGIF